MKLYAVEGNTQRLDGGAMFGNAPKEMWKNWITPDEQNRINLSCRALLIQTDSGKNILFETGVGAFFDPKLKERYGVQEKEHMLLKNLGLLGIRENEIDAIVLSHLHFDHAGGLLSANEEGPPRLLFPKAKIFIGMEHWLRANKPHSRERASFIPVLHELLKDSGRTEFVEGGSHPDLEGILFTYSSGHTMGLMLSHIQLSTGPLVFVSDLIPGMAWIRLPVTMGYDRFPELLVDEKLRLFEALKDKNAKLFFTHDPGVSCAALKQDNMGVFHAEPSQL